MKKWFVVLSPFVVIFAISWLILIAIDHMGKKRVRESQVIVMDGCEYFMCRHIWSYYSLTHKGNCTNALHRAGERL